MRTRSVIALAASVAGISAFPASSAADSFPNGASIASASLERLEQGDDATTFAAISGDGRYVVFDTRATNFFEDGDPDPPGAIRTGGVFRRDTVGGALLKVADGDVFSDSDGALVRRGAHDPSVSSDGRYIAFSTAQRLLPADTNDNIDVYRRDMDVAPGDPGAYVLISAKDGGDVPASYAPRSAPLPGRNPGSDVFPGRAISGDGNRVVFRTVELASNLPDHRAVDVPAGQLLVRDVGARRTRLVTRRANDGQPAGGVTGAAAISADGGTVAWVGANAPVQTRFLPGEQLSQSANFYLHRRIDAAPPVTRRITGVADPDDPACDMTPVGSNPTATGPCYGPLADTEEGLTDLSQRAPALSGDGMRVAFLAAAAGRPTNVNNPGLDLFVTDMRAGVTRKAGTRELTREGDPADLTQSASIESVTIAADGVHLLITTLRTRFVLPAISPVGAAFRRQADAREIYAIDLRANTVERVLHGLDGEDPGGDAGNNPSLSADGSTIAFTSTAGNLFFGDANERSDAFWLRRTQTGPAIAPPPDPPPARFDSGPSEAAGPRLRVSPRRRSNGSLALSVNAPGAGRIIALARSGKPLRKVASASRTAAAGKAVTLTLRLRGRALARLRARRRLDTTIRVRFVPKQSTQKTLTRVLKTRFQLGGRGKAGERLDNKW